MSSPSISNTEPPAYLGFYGLQTSPFSLAPRPRFTFPARAYSRALVELTEALRRREGLTVVIGESGTGKTMLVRTVLQQYDRPLFLSMVVNPFLSAGDLMWQVLSDFGVLAQLGPNEGPLASSSVNDLIVVLERFLSTRMQTDARAIVAIDDAHQLHSRVFEELRALSNLEANGTKLLQIVLIGQKQLDVLFRKPEGRQIEQRVTRRCVLEPLTRPEVGEYIAHRLTAARDRDLFVDGSYNLRIEGADARDVAGRVDFDPAAINTIAEVSRGVPRAIDLVADRALELGFERQSFVITRPMVLEAAGRSGVPVPILARLGRTNALTIAGVAAGLLIVALVGWPMVSSSGSRKEQAPVAAAAPSAGASRPSSSTPPPSSSAARTSAPREAASATSGQEPVSVGKLQRADSYLLLVSSFKSSQRAAQVVSQLTEGGLPAFTRVDPATGWSAVFIGPYVSPDEAKDVQKQVSAAQFDNTRIRLERSAR